MVLGKDSVIYRAAKIIYRVVKDTESSLLIKANRRRKADVIRVGFLAQEPSIWDKLEPIFREMTKDKRFEPLMFVVPPIECFNIGDSTYKSYKFEDNYFIRKYPMSIKTVEADELIDILEYDLKYLFYQRPYDDLLPVEYRSESLFRKVRVCYMVYFNSINSLYKNIDNFWFLKNTHIAFFTCDEEVQYEKRNLWAGCLLGAHKFFNVGYPMLDRYLDIGDSGIDMTILWTPRWTPELKSGGSNFQRYMNDFVSLRSEYEQANIIARPHPLTFNNFVSKGLLSEEEVKEYKDQLKVNHIELDESEDTFGSFERASVLISDYSSVILPFYLTGKPIIYCTVVGATGLEFTNDFSEVVKTLYIAETWDDVIKYLEMIDRGNDYLSESRSRVIEEKYFNKKNSTSKILNIIQEDYHEC